MIKIPIEYQMSFVLMVLICVVLYNQIQIESLVDRRSADIEQLKSKMDFYPHSSQYEAVREIGKLFASNHNYSESYNCQDYSNDIQEVFQSLGIRSYRVSGCKKDNSSVCHRWVRVTLDFEPIWGEFTDYDEEYEVYEVHDSE